VDIEAPDLVELTLEHIIEGIEASDLRREFDTDLDNTVSQTEYDEYLEVASLEYLAINDQLMQIEDGTMTCSTVAVSFNNLVGTHVDSTVKVTIRVDVRYEFDFQGSGRSVTYTGVWDATGAGFDMWDVTDDSSYRLKVSGTYDLDISSLQHMEDQIEDGDVGILLDGTEMQNLWNDTMGQVTSITVVKPKQEDGDSPGLGIGITAAAILCSMVVASRRQRR
jgi:hypothetical protein